MHSLGNGDSKPDLSELHNFLFFLGGLGNRGRVGKVLVGSVAFGIIFRRSHNGAVRNLRMLPLVELREGLVSFLRKDEMTATSEAKR